MNNMGPTTLHLGIKATEPSTVYLTKQKHQKIWYKKKIAPVGHIYLHTETTPTQNCRRFIALDCTKDRRGEESGVRTTISKTRGSWTCRSRRQKTNKERNRSIEPASAMAPSTARRKTAKRRKKIAKTMNVRTRSIDHGRNNQQVKDESKKRINISQFANFRRTLS